MSTKRRAANCLTATLLFALAAVLNAAPLYAANDKTIELAKKESRVSFYTSMGADESKMVVDAIDYVMSKEGQMLIKNMGRVISRSDIPHEEFAKAKIIPEDPAIADRLNPLIEEYRKYLH